MAATYHITTDVICDTAADYDRLIAHLNAQDAKGQLDAFESVARDDNALKVRFVRRQVVNPEEWSLE